MRIARSALLLALAAAALACEPAAATFPGRNGEIVLVRVSGGKYSDPHMELLRFAPRLGEPTSNPVCARTGSPLTCSELGEPAVAPDGATFVAVANEAQNFYPYAWALWLVTPDGQRVGSHPLGSFYSDVRWAPDASALIASRTPEGMFTQPWYQDRSVVVVLNPDGSERELVATDASQPDWCADGHMLVVQYGEIRVVDPDGELRRLTRRGGSEPSCSPSSRSVAFTRNSAIWTIPVTGGRARKRTKGIRPVWSPDGRQIAYLRGERNAQDQLIETFVYRIGLRLGRVRLVSKTFVRSDDPYDDTRVMGPEWRPLPPR
jgi:dipeptidyl aminopeptidase/acylaminoacyl peptidase